MSHALEIHDCATSLRRRDARTIGDTIICACTHHFTLRPVTRWLEWQPWRWHESSNPPLVWVRDKAAERAYRRERTLRAREWRRS